MVATHSAERSKDPRLHQFLKTKMCKFNQMGLCVKGATCMFAHDARQLQTPPDLRYTKLCKRLVETGVCGNKDCSFAHHADELRSASAFHKTKLCRFNQMGYCALGAKCNFAHSNDELQQLEATESERQGNTITLSAKVSCASEARLEPPPGLQKDDGVSTVPMYGKSELPEGSPAYVPLPESYSAQPIPYAFNFGQDMHMASFLSANESLKRMWGPGTAFGLYSDIEVTQADNLWQMKHTLMGEKQPQSIRAVRTSETTLCSLGETVEQEFSGGLQANGLLD